MPRGLLAPRSTCRARNCRAEAAALLATGRRQPKAGARPGDGQSLKRPAALSALPLNWPAAEPGAGLDTTPGGWLAGVDDDKAARDLIEALHDLLDGFDAGEFDDRAEINLSYGPPRPLGAVRDQRGMNAT